MHCYCNNDDNNDDEIDKDNDTDNYDEDVRVGEDKGDGVDDLYY